MSDSSQEITDRLIRTSRHESILDNQMMWLLSTMFVNFRQLSDSKMACFEPIQVMHLPVSHAITQVNQEL